MVFQKFKDFSIFSYYSYPEQSMIVEQKYSPVVFRFLWNSVSLTRIDDNWVDVFCLFLSKGSIYFQDIMFNILLEEERGENIN